jgi:imidazolonepropionase-like amidohydrolase
MRWQVKVIGVALTMVATGVVGSAQGGGGGGPALARFLAPPEQVVAIRAGRLFDSKAGTMSNNQVILIKGDRITDVGPSLAIPQGARVIDLSGASVLPGMMDTHVHLFGANGTSTERVVQAVVRAQAMLGAGFTTLVDMDSRGGFSTVDIRNLINVGTMQGPRLQVVGQALNPRAGTPYPATERNGRFGEPFVEDKNINSPWLARGAVREAALHGVDMVKYWANMDFRSNELQWDRDAKMIAPPSMTKEEMTAIAEEAHQLGLRVACHALGGVVTRWVIEADCDIPMHMHEMDDGTIKMMVQKKVFYQPTVMDFMLQQDRNLKQTGSVQAVRLLHEVGHDSGQGVADGDGQRDGGIELAGRRGYRQHREGEVRGHHRRVWKPPDGHHRDRAREVRHERRGGRPQRPAAVGAHVDRGAVTGLFQRRNSRGCRAAETVRPALTPHLLSTVPAAVNGARLRYIVRRWPVLNHGVGVSRAGAPVLRATGRGVGEQTSGGSHEVHSSRGRRGRSGVADCRARCRIRAERHRRRSAGRVGRCVAGCDR